MPGAGGVIAGNHIYGPAPQDGTKMLLSHAIPLSEKLEPTGVRFESAKFNWLGAYDAIVQALTLWHTAPVNNVDELKTANIVVGSFSKTHLTYQWASLLKDAIGAQVQGGSGLSQRQRLQPRDGARRDRRLDGVVGKHRGHTAALAGGEEGQDAGAVHARTRALSQGRADAAGTRAEGKKDVAEFSSPARRSPARWRWAGRAGRAGRALRKAFDALMKDAAFLADAKKRNLSIDPRDATKVNALVKRLASARPI